MSAMGPWELAARSQELAMQAERLRRDRAGSDRQPKLSVAPTTVEHMFEYDGRPPVGRIGGALDQLAGEELAGLPVAALGEDVVALGIARNQLEAEFARRLVAFDRGLSLIHISEPTRLLSISYAVFCLKKKNKLTNHHNNNT